MNAQYLGPLDLAPRSHPNDGRLDALVLDSAMPWRARVQSRRRARSGTHLPHPQLVASQAVSVVWSFDRPLPVRVDGVRWGSVRSIAIRVAPDALIVHA
jgi:diacylglycerol kinase family enzyme